MSIGSYRAIRTSDRWSYRYNLKLDGVSGFEPENADIKDRCRNRLAIPHLFGVSGWIRTTTSFEPDLQSGAFNRSATLTYLAVGWGVEPQCRGLTVRCFTG